MSTKLINCKSRQDARNQKKELGGTIIDNGVGAETRWQLEIQVSDPVLETETLSCFAGGTLKLVRKSNGLNRNISNLVRKSGKVIPVLTKRSRLVA